ncbi:hypothetical protein ACN2C7_06230 [Caulobacter sp. ErkDOM-E]|jgi:hypothetical protein|uniref:hypothetical protein n=1 Tax=Caulobacter sp. ErkDOM-E TaxID=3402778 RepID=UPI003AF63E82
MTVSNRRDLIAGLAITSASLPLVALASARPARVMVLASMHKRHGTSSSYTYGDLYAAVANFKPDFVGVEIRPEDLGRGEDYLSQNYPAEMVYLSHTFAGRVFGFDWLGNDVAGRAVPDDWWKARSPIKKLEREMDAGLPGDARHSRLGAQLDALSEQLAAILINATVTSLSDGRYDRVAKEYYATFRALTVGTRFAAIPAFYDQRDKHIIANILATAKAHPDARIAVVAGADHHGPIVAALSRAPRSVSLLPPMP